MDKTISGMDICLAAGMGVCLAAYLYSCLMGAPIDEIKQLIFYFGLGLGLNQVSK